MYKVSETDHNPSIQLPHFYQNLNFNQYKFLGVHNHKPKPLKQSVILSIEQAKQYYESVMSSFIQQNPENNSSLLPLQIPQQQNCYTPTTSKEGNNGKILNCDSWKINGMRNIGWRFSLASCFSELRILADGFMLDLSCTE